MIRRRFTRNENEAANARPKGFDDFELRLGDTMRGERATMGKSLLDVERELKIKAAYIAAIENSDPSAFDTPGFIPGYVRSYSRYLGMDPDESFAAFCEESGFSTAHGMSAQASSQRKPSDEAKPQPRGGEPLIATGAPYLPESDGFFARIEPGAIGSVMVLVALIGAIGYGGWTVLNEVQRVQFAPVENTPDVLADLDPIQAATLDGGDASAEAESAFKAPEDDRLDRLYRPEALDVPVLVARDAPISTLDPRQIGALRPELPELDTDSGSFDLAAREEVKELPLPTPQVVEEPLPGVKMIAVRPSWVRVKAADGTVIFEGIMNAGDTFDVPLSEEPPVLRAGNSGSIYFAINGQHYGPVGEAGSVTSDLALKGEQLSKAYAVADIEKDRDLSSYVAELQSVAAEGATAQE